MESLNVARYNWPLARVLEVYPDPKGVVRTARVLCKGEEYRRPVAKLVRLELDSEDAINQRSFDDDNTSESADSVHSSAAEERYDDFQNESVHEAPSVSEPSEPCESHGNELPVAGDTAATPREPVRAVRPVRRAAVRQRERLAELLKQDLI